MIILLYEHKGVRIVIYKLYTYPIISELVISWSFLSLQPKYMLDGLYDLCWSWWCYKVSIFVLCDD